MCTRFSCSFSCTRGYIREEINIPPRALKQRLRERRQRKTICEARTGRAKQYTSTCVVSRQRTAVYNSIAQGTAITQRSRGGASRMLASLEQNTINSKQARFLVSATRRKRAPDNAGRRSVALRFVTRYGQLFRLETTRPVSLCSLRPVGGIVCFRVSLDAAFFRVLYFALRNFNKLHRFSVQFVKRTMPRHFFLLLFTFARTCKHAHARTISDAGQGVHLLCWCNPHLTWSARKTRVPASSATKHL